MSLADAFASPGAWYKGNLHTHTSNSDGRLAPEQAARLYAEHGYHFLSLTDHNRLTLLPQQPDFPLLIPGQELDFSADSANYHLLGLDLEQEVSLPRPCTPQAAIDRMLQPGGQVLLCHPYWLGQTVADLVGLEGALGLEVFNTTCEVSIGKGLSSVHWDDLLARGKRLLGLAVDDAHCHVGDWAHGWVMVKALELSRQAIMQALITGHFYSSQGPEIHHLELDGGQVRVRCSPVCSVRFMSDCWRGHCVHAPAGCWLTQAAATLPPGGKYLRVEVVDERGRRAWTNPLFLDE